VKHFPETWFAGTRAGRQNAGGGSETPLSLDLLHVRRRDGRVEKQRRRELRRRGWVDCYSPLSSDWRTPALYRRSATTPWFDLLYSRNRPWNISTCNRLEISHVTCVPVTPGWRGSLGMIFDNQINKRQNLNCRLEHVTTRSHIVTSHAINNVKRERASACGSLHSPLFVSCEQ
jgi:hypothetical protein